MTAHLSAPRSNYTSVVGSLAALLWGASIALVGSTLLGILLALRMEARGFDTTITSIVMAGNFAGFMIGALYAPRLINRVGHIRAFSVFATLQSALFIMHPIMDAWWAWAIFRLAAGACLAGMFTAVESWMNDRTPAESRGTVLGIYVLTNYVAQVAGQLLLNLWDFSQVEPFLMASIFVSLSLLPLALTRMPAPELSDVQPLSFLELYRSSPTAVIGTFGGGVLVGSTLSLGAVFAQRLGLSVFDTTLFTGAILVGGMVFTFPVGRMADTMDRRYVMVALLLVATLVSLALVTLSLTQLGLWSLLVCAMLFGGAQAAIYPISVAQGFDHIAPERYTAAASGLLIAFSIGATLGPILASFAMGWQPQGLFATTGILSILLAIFISYRVMVREAVPVSEQESVTFLGRTPEAVELLDLGTPYEDAPDTMDRAAYSEDQD